MFDSFDAIVLYITPARLLHQTAGKVPVFQYCFQPLVYDKLFGNEVPRSVTPDKAWESDEKILVPKLPPGCKMYTYTNSEDNLKYWIISLKNAHDPLCGLMLEQVESLRKLNDTIKLYFSSFSMDIKQTTTTISSVFNSASAFTGGIGQNKNPSSARLTNTNGSGPRLSDGTISASTDNSHPDKVLNMRRIVKDCDRIVLIIQFCNQMNGTDDFNRLIEVIPFRKTLSDFINETTKSLSNVQLKSNTKDNLKILRESEINRESRVVPWRSSSLKYINNEIYLDVIEEVSISAEILKKSKKQSMKSKYSYENNKKSIVYENVNGKIDMDSQLSHDSPNLELGFIIEDEFLKSYHQCVKELPNRSNALHFIPPDGKFTLMKYNIFKDPHTFESKSRKTTKIPIELDYEGSLGIEKDQFEIKLMVGSNMMKIESIQDLKVKIFFNDPQVLKDELKVINSTHGSIESITTNTDNKTTCNHYEWGFTSEELKRLDIGSMVSIRMYTILQKIPSRISMSYTIVGGNLLYNNLQVKNLDVINNASLLKPFKGVKYTMKMKDYMLKL